MIRFVVFLLLLLVQQVPGFGQFTLESVTSYPFPSELAVSPAGSGMAVAVNEKGIRNVYVAEGPDFVLRKLTHYNADDGQEITGVQISPDGKYVLYVVGADHGAFDGTIPRNPASLTITPSIRLYSIPFKGGKETLLDEGDDAVIAPDGKTVAYIKNGQVRVTPIDGSVPSGSLFYTKGRVGALQWSPDGSRLLFVASRGDHSFVGVYKDSASPIRWIDPGFARDQSPRWSPDGKKIVFVRRPAVGGAPDSLTVYTHQPWSIRIADVETGRAQQVWRSPGTLQGSVPAANGRYNLHWAADNRIIFLSYGDGWPHLYSVPAAGGEPLLLTPGNYMVEHVRLSQDKKWLVFSANHGPDAYDYERRHIARVPVDKAAVEVLTPGAGIESFPAVTGDGKNMVMLSADAIRPALPAVMPFQGGKIKLIGESLIPPGFPGNLVIPKPVTFKASDGKTVYAQLFEPVNKTGKKPAVLFIHGGPQRQMLLGWHFGDYYANTYALNQYLANEGFVVLSVNYRLGVGYGYDFQHPPGARNKGASEYLDVKAAGEWLAKLPQVDAKRIGVYGGSYGGFLTAMALAKDSDLFAAGVDIHGVHDFMTDEISDRDFIVPDAELLRKLTVESSPITHVDTWRSPVLLIHGDDDGNVPFKQSVDLVRRFEQKGFTDYEVLVIPDETHHWMKYENLLQVDKATVEFLIRKLK